MKIIVERVMMKETKPGDILSPYDQEYFDAFLAGDKTKPGDLGITVMLRSAEQPTDGLISEQYISRLTIHQD